MSTRREFVEKMLIGGAALLALPAVAASDREQRKAKAKPLRILILGGTGHVGPNFVQAALSRGHKVAVFTRRRDGLGLPPGVEILTGDRNDDLASIKKRRWDAVIDVATYGPSWVRSLGEALGGNVGHYTFISSINVYDHTQGNSEPTTESSKLLEYTGSEDPYTSTKPGSQYGALKVLCEREAEVQFPGKTLVLRPCYLIGPGDGVGAFTYWAARMAKGGEVLAAGDPLSRIHVVDIRDVAPWAIELIERSETGAFNTVGPQSPTNWAGLLRALRPLAKSPVTVTWLPQSWLAGQGIAKPSSNLLFWATGISTAGASLINGDKAIGKGLTLRSLDQTAKDTLDWYVQQPVEIKKELLGVMGKGALEDSMDLEAKLLTAWHRDSDITASSMAAR